MLLHQITIRLFLSKLNKIDLINQTVHRLPNRKVEIFAMFLPIETKLVRYHWHILSVCGLNQLLVLLRTFQLFGLKS